MSGMPDSKPKPSWRAGMAKKNKRNAAQIAVIRMVSPLFFY